MRALFPDHTPHCQYQPTADQARHGFLSFLSCFIDASRRVNSTALSFRRVPQPDCLIRTTANNSHPLGTKGYALDVSAAKVRPFGAKATDPFDRPTLGLNTARDVRRKRCGTDHSTVATQNSDQSSAGDIPNSYSSIRTAGNQILSVGKEADSGHG